MLMKVLKNAPKVTMFIVTLSNGKKSHVYAPTALQAALKPFSLPIVKVEVAR